MKQLLWEMNDNMNICVDSALVPDPRVENTPCILDIDMFHLLVGKKIK